MLAAKALLIFSSIATCFQEIPTRVVKNSACVIFAGQQVVECADCFQGVVSPWTSDFVLGIIWLLN